MRVLITGGCGFIGASAADRLAGEGHDVFLLDNFSRAGARANLEWLRGRHRGLPATEADVRRADELVACVRAARPELILHLAAQVAVTTSVADPRADFEINALGTFNVLEAARTAAPEAVVIVASTNKVYGAMEDLRAVELETRWTLPDLPLGVPETRPLDLHSPYGCSKGCGDQYALDYHRIYGLSTVVFRQSCVYGPRQFGVEDQGWVAWMTIACVTGRPLTIYGDGKQVRDLVHVDDLVEAYLAAAARPEAAAGRAFNIGGGPENAISIWREFGPLLERVAGRRLPASHAGARPGDQRVFVCDIRRARDLLGWSPRVQIPEGVERLHAWVRDHRAAIEGVLGAPPR